MASGVHENDMCQGGWRVCHSVVCPRSEQAEFTLPAGPEVRKLSVCAVLCALLEQSEVNPHQWFKQTNRVWTQEDITVGECVL